MKILCKLGIHRPLTIKEFNFTDIVSHKSVRNAQCPCGKEWMTDSLNRWFGFKVEKQGHIK